MPNNKLTTEMRRLMVCYQFMQQHMQKLGVTAGCILIVPYRTHIAIRIFTDDIGVVNHFLLMNNGCRLEQYLGGHIIVRVYNESDFCYYRQLRDSVYEFIYTDTYIRSEIGDSTSKPYVINKGKHLTKRIDWWGSLKQRKIIKYW